MELVSLCMTYARVKTQRGDWYGRTSTVYRRHLFSFAASLPPSVACDPVKVTRRHVQAWIDRSDTHSPAYKRIQLSAVRGFFRWLILERGLKTDPTIGVTIPDIPEPAPRAFSPADRLALLAVAERDPRDLLCCSLCFNDAHRRGEVARLLVEDVDFLRGTLSVRGKGYRGKISRVIPYSPTTSRALHAYLEREPARTGPLVRNRVTGGAISPARVGEIVANVIKDAGLKYFPGDGRSSHSGRHTVATRFVEAGGKDQIGMRFLGHKSHSTWQRYQQGAVLDLRQVHTLGGE